MPWPAAAAGVLLCAVATLLVGAVAVAAAPAQAPVNLSRSDSDSGRPALASAGGVTLAVWEEDAGLFFAREDGSGWSDPAPVPSALGLTPVLAAAPDGGFELLWSDFSPSGGSFEVFHSRYADGAWSLPENVSRSSGDALDPAIAVRPDGTRLAVWVEIDTLGTLVYAASAPPGEGWSSGPLPETDGGDAPDLAVEADAWHLVWAAPILPGAEPDVLYSRYADGGWSLPEVVSAGATPPAAAPALALTDAGEPLVAWRAGGDRAVVARRPSGGWRAPSDLGAASGPPSLVVDGSDLAHVAWPDGATAHVADQAMDGWATRTGLTFVVEAGAPALVARPSTLGLAAPGRDGQDPADVFFVELPFTGAPTATATPSPQVTASPTATAGPTETQGPSATATASPPATATGAATATATATTTDMPSPSPTGATGTPPPEVTPTAPGPTATGTVSVVPSATATPVGPDAAGTIYLPYAAQEGPAADG